ncbi:hypothetical protein EZ428_14695 [Pedobacter frigiditerrae]|uniref:Uncharacterized protein n=1 Tax=Pedobacter frigiditerrae TaxID=2530452 RepID=A0A4R0MTV4_9SPHI|nr:hypothetical protein [Pedobacter frigiditerrae]TCC90518.1 hypothetical protein EZ428_14695 [Pedobacter frigiditerrae]
MELHLEIVGFILIVLAFIHIIFPRYFAWKEQLKSLTLINKQLMYVHTFFIAVTTLLMGVLCMLCAKDLTTTLFGQKIAFGLALFWGMRLFFQFFVYSKDLWKGKRLETWIHTLFSILWFYISLVFSLVALNLSF